MTSENWKERETREERENRELAELMPAILQTLGTAWQIDRNRSYKNYIDDENEIPVQKVSKYWIRDCDNRVIVIGFNNRYLAANKGKIFIRGICTWHHQIRNGDSLLKDIDVYDCNVTTPTIGVSMSRGAAIISKQIVSKFLPEYEKVFQFYRDKLQAAIESETNKQSEVKRFGALLGVFVSDSYPFHNHLSTSYDSNPHIKFEYSKHGHTIEVTNLSTERAEQIIKFIRG